MIYFISCYYRCIGVGLLIGMLSDPNFKSLTSVIMMLSCYAGMFLSLAVTHKACCFAGNGINTCFSIKKTITGILSISFAVGIGYFYVHHILRL